MLQATDRGRSKRAKIPVSNREWCELRDYAAKSGLSLAQLLRRFSEDGIREVLGGGDPLQRVKSA